MRAVERQLCIDKRIEKLTRRKEKMIQPTKIHLAMANWTLIAQSVFEHLDWIALVHCARSVGLVPMQRR